MKASINGIYLGTETQEIKDKYTGNVSLLYKVGVLQGMEAMTFYCGKEVYDKMSSEKTGTPVTCNFEILQRDKGGYKISSFAPTPVKG